MDKGKAITQLKKAIGEEYELFEKLGEGGYGRVYRARHKKTGAIRAIKQIRRVHLDGENMN
jgi:serine/threonine protein kinase